MSQQSFNLILNLFIAVFLYKIKPCHLQRRMVGGRETIANTSFVAYLVTSPRSRPKLDVWSCGASIVGAARALTAASCLAAVSHPYVIAGYREYVNGRGIEYDQCTKRNKRRVIRVSWPKEFKVLREPLGVDSYIGLDIGVATVDKEFGFSEQSWLEYCSYIPKPIRISYDKFLARPGADVVFYGWGNEYIKKPFDASDHTFKYLHEFDGLVAPLEACNKDNMSTALTNEHMLCINGIGNLDGHGHMFDKMGLHEDDTTQSDNGNNRQRRSTPRFLPSTTPLIDPPRLKQNYTNRNIPSICQADQGGPLVTWSGRELVQVGTAAAAAASGLLFLRCRAPSLFVSTTCTGLYVDCMLNNTATAIRSCELLKTEEKLIEEKEYSWGLD